MINSANILYNQHIVSINDLSKHQLEHIIKTAKYFKKIPCSALLQGKVIASCFFESSTRTRLSFASAVHRLGGAVIGFDDSQNTAWHTKGETLADSVKIISSYSDAIYMRHPQEGAARFATPFSHVPIINAGDGANQHPTQTLLDLFTIYETQTYLEKLNIAFVGDLKYGRTVHSLVQALALFNCKLHFIAPQALALPDYLLEQLDNSNISYRQHEGLDEVLPRLDVLYMTRIQKERFDESEYRYLKTGLSLTKAMLDIVTKDNFKILHPLPRVDELPADIDKTPYACYFQQAANGVYVRMALLALVLVPEVVIGNGL